MSKAVITKDQISITEWFAAIGEVGQSNAFRIEDNQKADRLEILFQEISLAYERPEKFSARDLIDKTPEFAKILAERGDELCAIRLVPKREDLPKLRNRGLSIKECYQTWFLKQEIDPDDYIAYLCPHSETLLWSATFVVNDQAIFGEIIRGLHSQLTHGETESQLYQFRYDFKNWQWSADDVQAKEQVQKMLAMIKVSDLSKQKRLKEILKAEFSHDYLAGYFETTVWPDSKVRFVDYNRILALHISTPPPLAVGQKKGIIQGIGARSGTAKGKVVIVNSDNLNVVDFPQGSILVCDNTDVRYLPFMRQAAAIVTNRGGILTHAAIMARELSIPCIVDTKNATQILKDADLVEVNATAGVVKKINQ
ncbi:MAG: PEP-utilizing enzyme [Patescibacteria group bacterium]|jgi:phosphohistidine swiveling domain-containing protein